MNAFRVAILGVTLLCLASDHAAAQCACCAGPQPSTGVSVGTSLSALTGLQGDVASSDRATLSLFVHQALDHRTEGRPVVSTNAVPQPARSKETQVVLGGLWRPSPGLALQLSVPVRHLSASGSESVSYTELGDPEFSVSGIFCHKRNLMAVTFSLLLGLADDDLRNADGDRVDPSLQPGRGATSPGVRALVSRQLSDTYTLFIAGGIRLEAEDTRAGYRWGNRFDASAGVQARLDAFEVGGTLSRVTVAQSSRDGGTIDNTGSSTTHLIPYVRWNINDRFALTLADQVLLAADVKGEQRLPAHMISAGATIAF